MAGQEANKSSSQLGTILAQTWLQHRLMILVSIVCAGALVVNTVKCVNDYCNQPIVTKVSYVDSEDVSFYFLVSFLIILKKNIDCPQM